MELEKVKEMEDHLKDQMIYAGRPGMWEEWLNFQKEAKEARELAAKEKLRKKRETLELLLYSFYGLCGFLIVVPLVFLILAALK
jgi:hypothetical protein